MSLINSKGAVISLITSESDAYHCKLSSQVDFTNASELKEILGFDSNVSNGISNHCVDITRGLNVLQVYRNIVCSDNAILKDIEIIPFSTIFMCSDLYELIIHFPDNTTTTIYKQYYTCFDTILQELAVYKHVGILRLETLFRECTYDFSVSSYTLSYYFHHNLH